MLRKPVKNSIVPRSVDINLDTYSLTSSSEVQSFQRYSVKAKEEDWGNFPLAANSRTRSKARLINSCTCFASSTRFFSFFSRWNRSAASPTTKESDCDLLN